MDKITPHTLRYPLFDIYWDYAKTAFGLLIGIGGLIYGVNNLISLLFFGAIIVIFCFFGFQCYRRQKSSVIVDTDGLEFMVWTSKKIAWKSVNNIELRYFGRPMKDKKIGQKPNGVLHLTLKSDDEKITLDSSLYGFRYLVWCATQVAKECKAPLDPGTVGNMLDIGLDPDGDSEMPDPLTAGL